MSFLFTKQVEKLWQSEIILWHRRQIRAAIPTDFNLGRFWFGKIETESCSRQSIPTPPFRAYFVIYTQAVKASGRAAQLSAE